MSEEHAEQRRRALEHDFRQKFEHELPGMIARALTLEHHRVVPNHHFAEASSVCVDLWRDGHFLAVVMLSQSINEGICRFVLEAHGMPACHPNQAAEALSASGIITEGCAAAIKRIARSYRNDVHHMNPSVARVPFEELAERNVRDLTAVESEIFAFDVVNGKLLPKNPRYWKLNPDGSAPVFLRCI